MRRKLTDRSGIAVSKSEQFLKRVLPIVELTGVMVGAAGCGIEIATKADIGYQLITCGAVMFGAGSFLWAKVYKK